MAQAKAFIQPLDGFVFGFQPAVPVAARVFVERGFGEIAAETVVNLPGNQLRMTAERIGHVFDDALAMSPIHVAVEADGAAVKSKRDLRGFEVDDAARNYIREHGFGDRFVHRTGHSIGTEVHGTGANMDNLETHDERRILPGALFSIEPGIYLEDFGVRSEVDVFVTANSASTTGAVQRELVRIG